MILVRQTKFNKSRLLPMHPSTMAALAKYANQRDRLLTTSTENVEVLRLDRRHPLDLHGPQRDIQQAGRKRSVSSHPDREPSAPRVHGLRHSFAVRTLLEWYRHKEKTPKPASHGCRPISAIASPATPLYLPDRRPRAVGVCRPAARVTESRRQGHDTARPHIAELLH